MLNIEFMEVENTVNDQKDNGGCPADQDVVSISNVAEKLTKVFAAFTTTVLALSIVAGVIVSQIHYRQYGIDYIQMADFEDYIRAALSNFDGVALTVAILLALFSLFGWLVKKLDRKSEIKSLLNTGIFIAAFFVAVVLIGAIWVDTSENDGFINDEFGKFNGNHLKLGLEGVWEVTFGRPKEQIQCVAFISRTGSLLHFWSIEEANLISVPQSQLVKLVKVANGMPEIPDYAEPPGAAEELMAWEEDYYSKRADWLRLIESSCNQEVKQRLSGKWLIRHTGQKPP